MFRPICQQGLIGVVASKVLPGSPAARSGLRAGLFHPTTGYSLPDAVRLRMTLDGFGPVEQLFLVGGG